MTGTSHHRPPVLRRSRQVLAAVLGLSLGAGVAAPALAEGPPAAWTLEQVSGLGGDDFGAFPTPPQISADGSTVLYEATLDGGSYSGSLLARDRSAGTTTLVDHGPDGSPTRGYPMAHDLSADGSTVVFSSGYTVYGPAGPGTTNWGHHVYLTDTVGGPVRELPLPDGTTGQIKGVGVSDDGATVVVLLKPDWSEEDQMQLLRLLTVDTATGAVLSTTTSPSPWADQFTVSADGDRAVIVGWVEDRTVLQVYDVATGEQVAGFDDYGSQAPVLDTGGSTVLYRSTTDELVVQDLDAATRTVVQVPEGRLPYHLALSGDGATVAYSTGSIGEGNRTSDDEDWYPRVYVAPAQGGEPVLVAGGGDVGEPGGREAGAPVLAADGRTAALVVDGQVWVASSAGGDADTTAPVWPSGAALTAATTDAGDVRLSWPGALDTALAGYDVTVDGEPLASVGPGSTELVRAVEAGDHTFAVVPRDTTGNRGLPLTATTAAVGSLVVTPGEAGTMHLSLPSADDVTGLRVLRTTAGTGADRPAPSSAGLQVVAELPADAAEWTDTGLAPLTWFGYRVDGVLADGSSRPLTGVSVEHTVVPAPGVTVVGSVTSSSAQVSWAAAPADLPVTTFRVERRDGLRQDAPWTVVARTTDTGLAETDLSPGRTYAWRVVAELGNGWGETPWATETSVRVQLRGVRDLAVQGERIGEGQAFVLGSQIVISAAGESGMTGSVRLTAATDGTGASVELPLLEVEPGQYRTDPYTLDGRELDRIGLATVTLTNSTRTDTDQIRDVGVVGGRIAVTVAPGVDLTGAVLRALGTQPGAALPIDGSGTVALDVTPGDVALDLLLPDGDVVATGRVQVSAAGTPAVTLTPVRHSELHVALSNSEGVVSPGSVTVSTPDGELLVAQSYWGGQTAIVLPGLVAGGDVVVAMRLADQTERTTQPSAPVTLTGGRVDVALQQGPLPRASLQVQVTGAGQPLANGTVTVVQDVEGRTFTTTGTVTQGMATVAALAGPASARVESPYFVGSGTAVTLPGSMTLDLVREPTYRIRPHLLTTNTGSATIEQPMDWITGVHFRLGLSVNGVGLQAAADVPVEGRPGDVVRLCGDGAEAGLSSGCAEVVLGEERDVDLTLSLEQVGSATARLIGADGTPVAWWQAEIMQRPAAGEFTWRSVGTQRGTGSQASISLPDTGDYQVAWSTDGNGSGRSDVRITDRTTVDLGTIALQQQVWSGDQPHVAMTPSVLRPGGTGTLRLAIPPTGREGLVAWVHLDEGITATPGTALVDGVPVTSRVTDGSVLVTLPHGRAAVVRIPVQVAAGAGEGQRSSQAGWINGAPNQGFIPTAYYEVRAARIEGPSTVATPGVPVSGEAPAGSPVTVRDASGRTLGTATAGPGGRWSTQVQLYNPAAQRRYSLVATVGEGDQAHLSRPYTVTYDPGFVQPDLITVTPTDGYGQQTRRETSFDPRQGVASMTMIYVPHERMRVSARFVDASRVHGFTAYVGALSATGSCTATTCVAWLPAGSAAQTGDIWVDYDVDTPMAASWADVPVGDEDARRNALPLDWRNPLPSVQGSGTTTFTVGGQFEVTAQVAVTRQPMGSPSGADLALQQATGLPVQGYSLSSSQAPGELTLRVRAGLPESWLTAEPAQRTAQLGATDRWLSVAEVLFTIKALGSFDGDIRALFVDSDEAKALDDLRRYVLDRIAPCAPAQAQQLLDQIMYSRATVAYYRASNTAMGTLGLLGGQFAPAFAEAGIVLSEVFQAGVEAVVGEGFELLANSMIADEMDGITAEVREAPLCDPKMNTLPLFWQPPAGRPHWIYDPSGTVYEAVASQPLAGVTATVYSGASANGPWTVWDAAAYGQTNPQPTTATGYYGWDVPQGWWRVEYTAPGYRPAVSAPMQVLPEHYGVDVDLHRLAAPALSTAAFTAAGALTVEFDQWMSVDSVRAGTSLRLGSTAVAGTLSATGAQRAPDGVLLARSFTFTPTTPLPSQASVRLVVAGATVDHGDVALGADATRDLRAPARPDAPVACGTVTLTATPTSRVAPNAVVTATVTAPAGAPVQVRGITTYSVVEWLRALLTGQGAGARPSVVLAEGRADAQGRVVLTFRATRDALVFAQQSGCSSMSRLVVVDVR